MCERVVSHDRLVGLHHHASNRREQSTRCVDFTRVDLGVDRSELILSRADRHHDFFERRVACTLANAIHGALDLTRACADGRKAIGHRQAEIVVAMDRIDHVFGARHPGAEIGDQARIFVRGRVAHGIRNVER